jgi:hypothetical protein
MNEAQDQFSTSACVLILSEFVALGLSFVIASTMGPKATVN